MVKIPKVILLIENSREPGRGVLRGIAKYSFLRGPWTFYTKPPFYFNPVKSKKELISQMKEFDPDGIITRDSEDVSEIAARGVPIILFNAIKPVTTEFPSIFTNDCAIGKMAAVHLLDLGFRQFAFCGFYNIPWSAARGRAFSERIAQAGLKTYPYKISKSQSKLSGSKERLLLANWLKILPKPLGLMACNDDRAQQVAEACKIADIYIPEQVAIIGVDNDDMVCNLNNPQLSSIAAGWERAGYEAAELLDKLMAGKKVEKQNITVRPSYIVTRQSTDILAIEDHEVANAVRYIRQHTRGVISVDDVVNAVTISRRVLEKRFRKILHCSILDEIRSVHAAQVAKMLVDSNLSISQIASALGYPTVKHIARSFRHKMGMTLLAYRKQFGQK